MSNKNQPRPINDGQRSGNENNRSLPEGLNKGHIPDFKYTSTPPPKPNNPQNKK